MEIRKSNMGKLFFKPKESGFLFKSVGFPVDGLWIDGKTAAFPSQNRRFCVITPRAASHCCRWGKINLFFCGKPDEIAPQKVSFSIGRAGFPQTVCFSESGRFLFALRAIFQKSAVFSKFHKKYQRCHVILPYFPHDSPHAVENLRNLLKSRWTIGGEHRTFPQRRPVNFRVSP